jgi:hypothetical protein
MAEAKKTRGRPKGSTKAKSAAKKAAAAETPKEETVPVEVVEKCSVTPEVKAQPLNISASIGACFKTGRVGITSLSIQTNYTGCVSAAVDELTQKCFDEWHRLEDEGKTQTLPDTVSHSHASTQPSQTTTPAVEELESDLELPEEVDGVQAYDTVKDGEAALKNIEDNELEKNAELDADLEDDLEGAEEFEDDLDDLEAGLDDGEELDGGAVDVDAEEVVDEEHDIEEPQEMDNDMTDALGIEDEDLEPEEDEVENLEENGSDDDSVDIWDMDKKQLVTALKDRDITEINGKPVEECDDSELIIKLSDELDGENG